MFRTEKQFSLILALIIAAIFFWPLTNQQPLNWLWGVLSATVLLIGWLKPHLFTHPTKFWLYLGHGLASINNKILLAMVFYFLISPLAVLFKLTGRDVLNLKMKKASTHWVSPERISTSNTFKKQF